MLFVNKYGLDRLIPIPASGHSSFDGGGAGGPAWGRAGMVNALSPSE